MKNRIATLIYTGLVATTFLSSAAFAQDANIPDHPRVNEVDQRLQNQQNRVNAGTQDGQMTNGQAYHDEKRDAAVSKEESRDEAKHDGHLTKREQRRMNRQLNKNSRDIHKQRHHGRKHKDQTPPAAQ